MTKIQQLFVTYLRRHRLKRQLSQSRLAELCDVSSNYISELEKGRKFPSAETFDSLVAALQIRHYELFLDEEDLIRYADSDVMQAVASFLGSKLNDAVAEAKTRFKTDK